MLPRRTEDLDVGTVGPSCGQDIHSVIMVVGGPDGIKKPIMNDLNDILLAPENFFRKHCSKKTSISFSSFQFLSDLSAPYFYIFGLRGIFFSSDPFKI